MTTLEPITELPLLSQALREPDVRADPYPFYRRLREGSPRCHTTEFDAWVFTCHADAALVLRDPRFSSDPRHQIGYDDFVEMARGLGFGPIVDLFQTILLTREPPDHTRLRKLASKAFTPKAVEAMRPHITELVASYLDAVAGDGELDVVADLAAPLPITVICEMLGIPEADRDQLRAWTAAATVLIDPGDNVAEFVPANEAVQGFDEYLSALIEERRQHPGDDVLSALVAAEEQGDQLTRRELVSMVTLLFGAGHETTVNLIGNGMLAFLRNPDQWVRVAADPSLVPSAVEEMLRYDSPVQLTGRNVTEDVDFDGLRMRRGQQIAVLLGAANRDPEVFADPDRFDVGRNDNRHLAFGGGIHHCLGAALARIEAQEAVRALASRFPRLELLDDDPPRKETINLRGLASLRVATGG